jgi:3D (Asp-Asp-Asp) domain-containing protein
MRFYRRLTAIALILGVFLPIQAFASENSDTQTQQKDIFTLALAPKALEKTETGEGIDPYTEEEWEQIRYDARMEMWKKKQTRSWEYLPKDSFTINASAYTAAADECGKSDGITASGIKVEQNRTLACPPEYPFGVKIHIDGMGTYTCEDRGGAIKGNKFDIYMETKAEAFAFGRRNLLAYVME